MFGLSKGPILDSMLKMLTSYMRKEGVTAIVLRQNNLIVEGDTPGVEVKSYSTPVGIVDGDADNKFVRECFALRDRYRNLSEEESNSWEPPASELMADTMKLFISAIPKEGGANAV